MRSSHNENTLRLMRVLDSIQDFDRRTLLLLQQSESWVAQNRRGISRTADGYLYVVIGVVFVALAPDSDLFFRHIILAFGLERVSYWLLKNSLRRKRPYEALPGFRSQIRASDEFSFPSGHTSAAFLFITLLVLHGGPLLIPLYAWAMAVGMSRVYLGVHFPTDTVMGATLGTGIALSTAYWLF
jgi:undecaprenyl-diphosphatase